jgi:hypothetical protein
MNNALQAALARRTETRAHVEEAVSRSLDADEAAASAKAEATRRRAEKTRWRDRFKRDHDVWVDDGRKGPPPVLVADARAMQLLSAAEAAEEVTAQTAAERKTVVSAARQADAAAEAAVQQVTLAILADEGDALAREILDRDAETDQMRVRLQGLRPFVPPTDLVRRAAPMEGDWLHVPIPQLRAARTSTVARDPLHTPLHKIGTSEADPAAVQFWQARRESLVSGEESAHLSAAGERAA